MVGLQIIPAMTFPHCQKPPSTKATRPHCQIPPTRTRSSHFQQDLVRCASFVSNFAADRRSGVLAWRALVRCDRGRQNSSATRFSIVARSESFESVKAHSVVCKSTQRHKKAASAQRPRLYAFCVEPPSWGGRRMWLLLAILGPGFAAPGPLLLAHSKLLA